jgi:hypothetical protein
VVQNLQPVTTSQAIAKDKSVAPDDIPSFIPAPKSLVSDRGAAEVATVNSSKAGTQNAILTSMPKAAPTSLNTGSTDKRVAQIKFLPTQDVMKVGERRRFAIQLDSDVGLTVAMLALRFDPKVVKVNSISAGSLIVLAGDDAPTFTQFKSNQSGMCMVSISTPEGKSPLRGTGSLILIDVEAIGIGDASFIFDKDTLHLVSSDARDVSSAITQGVATVQR